MKLKLLSTIGALCAIGLSTVACAGAGTTVVTVTVTATPSDPVGQPTQSSDPVVPATPDPVHSGSDAPSTEPTDEFREVPFGDSITVTTGGDGEEIVTLGKPTLAVCQYQSIGCDDPEIGERVVQIPITIENAGNQTAEWGSDYFVLEFADGTQVATGDGAAFDYTPDNYMDYDVKVRAGSTFKSVLVFEAPKGAFKVLILSDPYDGEPFAAWF